MPKSKCDGDTVSTSVVIGFATQSPRAADLTGRAATSG